MNVRGWIGAGGVAVLLALGYVFREELGWSALDGDDRAPETIALSPTTGRDGERSGLDPAGVDRRELERAARERGAVDASPVAEVVAGAGVRGRLLDPSGAPLPGIPVRVTRYRGPRGAEQGVPGSYSVLFLANAPGDEFESVLRERPAERGVIEAEVVTDADGAFVLRDLREAAPLQLDARHVEFLSPGLPFQLRRGERLDFGDVTLHRGGRLQGRVVDERDDPWTDVRIEPDRFRELLEAIHGAEGLLADGEGRFDLGPIPPGEPFLLKVQVPGVPTITQSIDPLYPGEVRVLPAVRLLRDLSLAGRVVDARGSGIPRVEVRAHAAQAGERGRSRTRNLTERPALTDERGEFRFHGIAEERLTLIASHEGRTARLEDVERGRTDVELRFAEQTSLRGTIREEGSGAVVAGARVQLIVKQGGVVAESTADEDGRYALDGLIAGERQLVAWSDRHVPKTSEAFPLAAGAQVTQDLAIVPGGSLRLRVLQRSDERPVPRARVWIRKAPKAEEGGGGRAAEVAFGDLVVASSTPVVLGNWNARGGSAGTSGPPEIREATTDDQGIAWFTGLEAAEYSVLVVPEAHARERTRAKVSEATGVAHHDVRVRAGGSLLLRVVRSSGESVAFQKVSIRPAGETRESYAQETDVQGTIRAEHLVPGEYVASLGEGPATPGFSPGGRVAGAPSVEFAIADGVATEATLQLQPLARLSVIVHEAGRPASGATVAVVPAMEREDEPGDRLRWADHQVVDPTGRRTFDRLEPGAYWISYQRHDRPLHAYERIEVAGEEHREVYVHLPGGVVEGTVTDEHGGPLERVRVSITRSLQGNAPHGAFVMLSSYQPGGQHVFRSAGTPLAAWTDSAGRFRIDGVPAGTFFLRYVKAGFGHGNARVVLRVDDRVETRHQLSAPGSVRGRLESEDGRPVRGARVRLFDGALSESSPVAEVWVGGDGAFRFEDLAAGTYRLAIEVDDEVVRGLGLDPEVRPRRSVEVPAGGTVELPLRWAQSRG